MLESMIVRDPCLLSSEWMLIWQQVITNFGGRIDPLAIAPDGSLVVIELKRDRTPRDVVAQALDYASWLDQLTADKISGVYKEFSGNDSLDNAFVEKFSSPLDEESLNQSHQIVIVAAELDASTERIVKYLNDRDIAINVLFFQVFDHGDQQLLSRAWLIDPSETQAIVASSTKKKGDKEPWNGEFYVAFGDPTARSWSDARQYGYVSAGVGAWYSQTLKMLSPGDRVWVNIPKVGYVGVGRVLESVKAAKDFTVSTAEGDRSVLDILKHADRYRRFVDDPVMSEYFVRVKWLDDVPEDKAINEVGLFGNQHTVC